MFFTRRLIVDLHLLIFAHRFNKPSEVYLRFLQVLDTAFFPFFSGHHSLTPPSLILQLAQAETDSPKAPRGTETVPVPFATQSYYTDSGEYKKLIRPIIGFDKFISLPPLFNLLKTNLLVPNAP